MKIFIRAKVLGRKAKKKKNIFFSGFDRRQFKEDIRTEIDNDKKERKEKVDFINKYGEKHNVKLSVLDGSHLSDKHLNNIYENVKDAEENYDIVDHKYVSKKKK